MKFTVTVKRRVLKGIKKMPAREQERLAFLIRALAEDTAQCNLHGQITANSPSPNITAT